MRSSDRNRREESGFRQKRRREKGKSLEHKTLDMILTRLMFLLMTIAFCPHLYADKEMVDDTVITMRVDTTVVQKIPHYLGN